MTKHNRWCLLQCFTKDAEFYIVRKNSLLVTDEAEIKIGAKIQFPYPEDKTNSKIKIGKIIMESESQKIVQNEMKKMKIEMEENGITIEDIMKEEKEQYEEKRQEYRSRARQDNIDMAKLLLQELDERTKREANLQNSIVEALNLTEETNASVLNIESLFYDLNKI
ncbi:uncharacterized protein LOC127291251 [Leptopilina boulardi]|uniref:uncharacterized protein LOC127291251 n=1 Tax=Leptopilina boulardi TaxID=63433 RepID=UPI0021F5EA9F|nr:uncharacterized protein LOC127291251 [Leptopilina boulardi]